MPTSAPAGRTTISAAQLSQLLGVPASVFAYLEARVPGVRGLTHGRERAYRADDAVLLAGLVELLYEQGEPLREVSRRLAAGERDAIEREGRRRLHGIVPKGPGSAASRPIPPDALVHHRTGGPASAVRSTFGADSEDVREILSELIACVRRLDGAR
ncbi:hypothetical protein [Acuticoccus sp.]|uniref:hypothetical protein n=1 Tax=Acuticoccus sp. TaxID=1904378 RepID=UPI003B515D80